MNSLTDFICDNIENFCFELVFNQSSNDSNEKYYEILDLTNDDDYQSYLNQEFHLTIEQRSSIKIL